MEKERYIRQEEQVNEQKKGSWGILGLLAWTWPLARISRT